MSPDGHNPSKGESEMADKPKPKAVFVIREDNGKSFWTKVGVAFVNRDDSLTVKLDANPLDGKLHIREAQKQEAAAERA
jgi:hypothetical protein